MALEIAVDEIAEKLGLDPVAFRVLNDTQVDPEKPSRPFSQRQLNTCLETGAEKFGWSKRAKPGTTRDGRWLVGMGVAAAFRNNLNGPSAARVRLARSGVVTVETDMTDIGTGTYTIIAQTAAEMMGAAARQDRREARRFGLSGLGGLGRAMGRQQLDRGGLCRLRKTARGGGPETRPALRCGLCRRQGEIGPAQRWRSAMPPRAANSLPKTRWNMATLPKNSSSRPLARISPRSASMR